MKSALLTALIYAGVLLAITATGWVSALQPGTIGLASLPLLFVAVAVIALAFVLNRAKV